MKKLILNLMFLFLFLTPFSASAIDFVWKNEQGVHYYECGGHVVGGRAEVKDLGRGMYRVRGVLVNRVIRANSLYHAAQITCGEKKEYEERTQVPNAD